MHSSVYPCMHASIPLYSSEWLCFCLSVSLLSFYQILYSCISFLVLILSRIVFPSVFIFSPSFTTSSSSSKGINILIALMYFQDPQLFPHFTSGGSLKSFSSGGVNSLPPAPVILTSLCLYTVRQWWGSWQHSSHSLFLSQYCSSGHEELEWEPRIGGCGEYPFGGYSWSWLVILASIPSTVFFVSLEKTVT